MLDAAMLDGRLAVLAIALWLVPASAAAQILVSDLDGVEVEPEVHWRLGDDASYAAVDVSPAGWRRGTLEIFPADWQGIGWLRFHLRVHPSLAGRPIGLRLVQQGAAEVFVDGVLVHRFGTPAPEPAGEAGDRTRDPRPVVFSGPSDSHVLAVRYSAWLLDAPRWNAVEPAVSLRLGELRPMVETRVRQVRLLTFHQMFLTGLFIAFALVNLMLFLFRPVAGPHLYCGLSAASAAATIFLNFDTYVHGVPADFMNRYALFHLAFLAMAVTSLRFVYACVRSRRPRQFWVFLAVGVALGAWSLAQPFRAQPATLVFMLTVNAEMIRAALIRREERMEGMWVLSVGALPLAVLSPYQLLAGLGVVPELWEFLVFPAPYYGLAVLMFSMTILIGLAFARTQRRLERELELVRQLSAEKLEQERLARTKEVERARLEVENSRRAAELEEARRLQTSMLPSAVPSSKRLEIAVHAETASEVGGDYYDFLPAGDGGLTVIVGDASGSGAQAGTLVAATKGMLLTYADPSPSACLDRVSQGLRKMGLRRRHMTLIAARFDAAGRRLILSAAAMPPVLIYRAAQAAVEAVMVPSLPLGSFRSASYEETSLELEPGDRVVMMSDGLPETVDAEIRPLGYDRIEELVAEHGALAPAQLIDVLVQAGVDHAGGHRADDDVTILVVGVR